MDFVTLIALLVAATINAAIPGPCTILTASRAARSGIPAGLQVSLGVLLGNLILLTTTLLVIVGALSISQPTFVALKWSGVAVLLVLALRTLLSAPAAAPSGRSAARQSLGDFAAGSMVGMSSPYSLAFMIALLPQFVPATTLAATDALLIIGTVLIGTVLAQTGATAVGVCSLRLARRRLRWIDYAGGALLFLFACASVLTPLG